MASCSPSSSFAYSSQVDWRLRGGYQGTPKHPSRCCGLRLVIVRGGRRRLGCCSRARRRGIAARASSLCEASAAAAGLSTSSLWESAAAMLRLAPRHYASLGYRSPVRNMASLSRVDPRLGGDQCKNHQCNCLNDAACALSLRKHAAACTRTSRTEGVEEALFRYKSSSLEGFAQAKMALPRG